MRVLFKQYTHIQSESISHFTSSQEGTRIIATFITM